MSRRINWKNWKDRGDGWWMNRRPDGTYLIYHNSWGRNPNFYHFHIGAELAGKLFPLEKGNELGKSVVAVYKPLNEWFKKNIKEPRMTENKYREGLKQQTEKIFEEQVRNGIQQFYSSEFKDTMIKMIRNQDNGDFLSYLKSNGQLDKTIDEFRQKAIENYKKDKAANKSSIISNMIESGLDMINEKG